MDAQPNTSVILHTYQQQPNLPEAYISAPLNDNNSFVGAGNSHFAANVWSNPTFSAATYPDAQFGGEVGRWVTVDAMIRGACSDLGAKLSGSVNSGLRWLFQRYHYVGPFIAWRIKQFQLNFGSRIISWLQCKW